MDQKDLITPELSIDSSIQLHLKETGMWARFLGITGFIMSVVVAIVAVFASSYIADSSAGYGSSSSVQITVMVTYLFIAGILFVMSLFLYRFGKKMKLALETTDQETLNASFLSLKQYHRMAGIITIIYLVIIVLAAVFTAIAKLGRY